MKLIGSGAEAEIFLDEKNNKVIKKRIKKEYRIPQIDLELRKSRTRIEAKILKILPIKGPKLISDDRTETIEMSYIEGPKLRDVLKDNVSLAKEIGEKLAILHDKGIIHGDLTTSNMILNDEIYFIDFGLSFFSEKIENKAVDIHLLKQALESKHHKIAKQAFELFLEGYKKSENFKKTIERFNIVEQRGRHKKK